MDRPVRERSELLTIALRQHVSDADADNKMKKTVTRIWLNPPEPAAGMIRWALEHPDQFPDHRAMHAGALLATVPYVGSVIAQLGRSFALHERPTVVDLRRRIVAQWGESSTVQEGVGKTITSLRRLDLVTGGGRTPINPRRRCPQRRSEPHGSFMPRCSCARFKRWMCTRQRKHRSCSGCVAPSLRRSTPSWRFTVRESADGCGRSGDGSCVPTSSSSTVGATNRSHFEPIWTVSRAIG